MLKVTSLANVNSLLFVLNVGLVKGWSDLVLTCEPSSVLV